MAQLKSFATIYVDVENNAVSYYSLNEDKIINETKKINTKLFTEEYYAKFTEVISEFMNKYTPANAANTTIIVPDNLVFTNTVTFPALKGAELKNTINTYLTSTYKNLKDLKIDVYNAVTTKRYITVSLTGVSNDIVALLKKACTDARLIAQNVSYASNATICAATSLNNKFRNDTYIFIDIKEQFARYIFVFKGKVVGFYNIKIGREILETTKPASEDVLLYQPSAELIVLNAREKARQKALTMMSTDSNVVENADAIEDGENEEEKSFTESNLVVERQIDTTIKVLPKKVARKLPKFMLREVPDDDNRKVYENFRLFIKWALELKKSNEKIASLGDMTTVYVNLPSEYDYLYDFANEEMEENGVKFVSSGLNKEKSEITDNLELYGGFFVKMVKQSTNF